MNCYDAEVEAPLVADSGAGRGAERGSRLGWRAAYALTDEEVREILAGAEVSQQMARAFAEYFLLIRKEMRELIARVPNVANGG